MKISKVFNWHSILGINNGQQFMTFARIFRDFQKINYAMSQSKYHHGILPPLLQELPQPPLLTKVIVYFFSWKSLIANGIDKIHTLSDESALLFKGAGGINQCLKSQPTTFQTTSYGGTPHAPSLISLMVRYTLLRYHTKY
ncbi:MAG: hypothetical protein RMY34_05295 [Aulosira sp. DedQUE10]|nr:hypothetical protein [Aulosira sp. DedQUE10]